MRFVPRFVFWKISPHPASQSLQSSAALQFMAFAIKSMQAPCQFFRRSLKAAMNTTDYRRYLEFAIGVPFTDGNTIKPLKNGVEIFPEMLNAIAGASTNIDFLTHVYWRGDIALRFANALADKAKEGLRVRVLLDAYGAKDIDPDSLAVLGKSAVELRWFRPLGTLRVWRTDKRTHRKILLVDDSTGFTGGVGIADEWSGNAENPGEWRDTHFSIQGPAVGGLFAAFLDNWNEAGDWSVANPQPASPAKEEGVAIQIVRSSSTVDWTEAASLVRVLIASATKSLNIVTPYFVPDDVLVAQLCQSAKNGVAVKIMISGRHTDSALSQLAGYCSVETLLRSGVQIYRYDKTLLHVKLIIIDGIVSSVGSTNLNHRSMGKDEECNANIISEDLAHSLTTQFEQDLQSCSLFTLEGCLQRPWTQRAKESLARLLVEQL